MEPVKTLSYICKQYGARISALYDEANAAIKAEDYEELDVINAARDAWIEAFQIVVDQMMIAAFEPILKEAKK